ncbi:MAG: hypothetical protein NUV54_01110 [Candidatus Taylorbacteria bacterium]|nr:hypothetical protein [Candidatus Taylorbacteria bacterium]
MNFESPNSAPEDKNEESGALVNKLKKATLVGGAVAAALSGEACSPDTGEATHETISMQEKGEVHQETAKSRMREQYEIRKKQSRHETLLLLANDKELVQAGTLRNLDLSINTFLKYYYQGLNGERNNRIFEEGQQMRVLEIAKSKGIDLDLSHKLNMDIGGGLVPNSAVVNGITVPISDSDYTAREKELLAFQKGGSSRGQSAESGGVLRQSPDFDKDPNF